MSAALIADSRFAADSGALARGLYDLLRDLDRANWREDLEESARQKLRELQRMARDLLASAEAADDTPSLAALALPVAQLVVAHENLTADGAAGAAAPRPAPARSRWLAFRQSVTPAYEALVSGLRTAGTTSHVPSLRPTNRKRMMFHVGMGVSVLFLLELVLTANQCRWVAGAFALWAWSAETLRRFSPAANDALMRLFSGVSHPQEAHRINSATWFTTAVLMLAIANEPFASAVGLTVLAFGDPAAAWVGRRYGRIRLVNGRSLEGTLTFVAVTAPLATLVLRMFHPEVPMGWLLSLSAAVVGALVELLSRRVDDNLSIPLAAAATAYATSLLV